MRQSFTKMVKKLWKERQQVVMMKLSDQVLTGTSRSLMEDSGHWVGVDRDLAPATTASCCQIQTASRLAVHDDNKQLQCESKKRPCGLLFISSSIIDHELAKFWDKNLHGFFTNTADALDCHTSTFWWVLSFFSHSFTRNKKQNTECELQLKLFLLNG